MRIGLAQINPVTGDLDGNTEKICRAMDSARQNGCDLVVFPESAITGYMTGDLLEIDDFVAANIRLLHERVVAGCRDMAAVVGYVAFSGQRRRGDRLVNAAAVIQDGRIVATAAKQNLCRYRYYDETRYFTPGAGTSVATLSIDGVERRLGILICEDLWDRDYPADPYLEAVQSGAEMILVINASPFETGKWTSRLERIREHQGRRPLPVAYVNSTAIGDNLKDLILFDGRSMFVDGSGSLAACASLFREDLCTVDLDDRLQARVPPAPRWSEAEELFRALVFALREYCRQTGFTQVLIGMSGGVDSSLCAVLAAEALGPQNVLGVLLPSAHSTAASRRSAREICRNTGISAMELPIAGLHDHTLRLLERQRPLDRQVTDENIQARLRGMLLMALANDTGRMVVATGNKTELGLGYCTLYGDMVGGLLLIGDLNKVQVYRLARYVNRTVGQAPIPREVMDRPPSAELAADQVDPFDYPVVAPVIDDLIARVAPNRIMERFRGRRMGSRYPKDIYERYDETRFRQLLADAYQRYQASAFKRAQASPAVVVSDRALGFDLRETIINKWSPGWG